MTQSEGPQPEGPLLQLLAPAAREWALDKATRRFPYAVARAGSLLSICGDVALRANPEFQGLCQWITKEYHHILARETPNA